MTNERKQLAADQAALLQILATAPRAELAAELIRNLSLYAATQDDRRLLDLRMVDVAMQLTRTWGVPQ